ncbi:uncharacterized protein LOC105695445 [Orussus abietinus]|uniref:uncharacterized protein LOC105695445 n=1 Tax=Orussus abietinus TaxID=222816 RepID=UPI000625D016|nr:uncharacterized protein LOC105695445 [Orussus abietinus]
MIIPFLVLSALTLTADSVFSPCPNKKPFKAPLSPLGRQSFRRIQQPESTSTEYPVKTRWSRVDFPNLRRKLIRQPRKALSEELRRHFLEERMRKVDESFVHKIDPHSIPEETEIPIFEHPYDFSNK